MKKLMKFHTEKGADISIIYKNGKIPHLPNMMCFDINEESRITGITVHDEAEGEGNITVTDGKISITANAAQNVYTTAGSSLDEEGKVDKNKGKIEKYSYWGVMLFVAVPLPGTGAWTGTLIASVLGLEPKKSFLAAVLGVLGATTIMTVISYCGLGAIFG